MKRFHSSTLYLYVLIKVGALIIATAFAYFDRHYRADIEPVIKMNSVM